jgi:uncharacterized protein
MHTEKNDLDVKFTRLVALIKQMGSVLVAFSGGVDSTLLLKVAHDVLGKNVLAVTAVSLLSSRLEKQEAVALADLIGAAYLEVASNDLSDPVFVANPPDKCYHCKKRRFALLKEIAGERGLRVVVDGTNGDDFSDYRPGFKAILELGIRSPLSEAGFSKDDIRRLSRQLKLPTWDKPSFACLASRVPYGIEITAENLKQIDEGEIFLRSLGICQQVRVRHHGALARLEVEPNALSQMMEDNVRKRITDYFKMLGYRFVALDMEGYAMGSLNREILSKENDQNG